MMKFGWRKRIARLRLVILSCAPQLAKELPPVLAEVLALFAEAAASGDARGLQQAIEGLPAEQGASELLWEPAEVYGWRIHATMYLREGKLWWLVHAVRTDERVPSDRHVAFLNMVLQQLGAEPRRHVIIGPSISPAGEPRLPFGWWTWPNAEGLYEVQLNKHEPREGDMIRFVPLGSGETEGYRTLDLRVAEASASDDSEETP